MAKKQSKGEKLRTGAEKIYMIIASDWDGCSLKWVEDQLKRLLKETK